MLSSHDASPADTCCLRIASLRYELHPGMEGVLHAHFLFQLQEQGSDISRGFDPREDFLLLNIFSHSTKYVCNINKINCIKLFYGILYIIQSLIT